MCIEYVVQISAYAECSVHKMAPMSCLRRVSLSISTLRPLELSVVGGRQIWQSFREVRVAGGRQSRV